MSEAQRIIKYLAMAFGIFLAVNIIGAIVFGIMTFAGIFGLVDHIGNNQDISSSNEIVQFIEKEPVKIQNLEIKIGASKLNIVEGDRLKVVTENMNGQLQTEATDHTLKIIEDGGIAFGQDTPIITLYLPRNHQFEKIKLETGISNNEINMLKAKKVQIQFGAGKSEIENLIADDIKLKGGVGKVEVKNSTLANLSLETGVGKFYIKSKITGDSSIKTGVGKVDIDLVGTKEDYTIVPKNGLGSLKVEGDSLEDNISYGNGKVTLKVENGIGSTKIHFVHS